MRVDLTYLTRGTAEGVDLTQPAEECVGVREFRIRVAVKGSSPFLTICERVETHFVRKSRSDPQLVLANWGSDPACTSEQQRSPVRERQ